MPHSWLFGNFLRKKTKNYFDLILKKIHSFPTNKLEHFSNHIPCTFKSSCDQWNLPDCVRVGVLLGAPGCRGDLCIRI